MKDSFWLGGLVGVAAPALAYILSNYTSLQTSFFVDKPIAIYVIAALINLITVRFTYRGGKETFAKGIIFVTFIAMLILVVTAKLKI
ncbi:MULTISPECIES: hypothetical protein [Sphingobacterium]|uniref:hypothetical protein n=1 Tax=Sphingobacterium TaxID=28453 RepID=UPI0013DB4080|nr:MULTISPECIES: hypothetical protein [unclassified Sphingobacterium]